MKKTRVVVIGGQKGGTSKSTIAQNLAVALALEGGDVMVIDTDSPQNTSDNWIESRNTGGITPAIHCSMQVGSKVGAAIADCRKRYSHVIVDTGASDSEELRHALARADVLVTPFKPHQADMWTVRKMNEIVSETRAVNPHLRALAVVSIAPANRRVSETATAADFLAGFTELTLAKTIIRDRLAYPRAMSEGRGVLEFEPVDEFARDEITRLYREVFQ